MGLSVVTLAAARKYTKDTIEGAGAVAGKPCQINSITDITGGHRVTFLWVDNSDVEHTSVMDVMDGVSPTFTVTEITGGHRLTITDAEDTYTFDVMNGEKGLGVKGVEVTDENHLVVTYDNDTEEDAGEITTVDGFSPTIVVKESTSERYVLTITDVDGSYDTPNLKGSGGSASQMSDLTDVSLTSLASGDLLSYDTTDPSNPVWKNSNALPLSVSQLMASMPNKVDKVDGKGLSTNDFTEEYKSKLTALATIYSIGSGLVLNSTTHELTATGISIPIDDELDETSPNPVQNGVITLAIEQLQGSLLNKVDKVAGKGLSTNDYDNTAKGIVDNVTLSIDQLNASLLNKVDKVDGKGLSTNDFTTANKTALESTIPLQITQLQGSLATKASQADLTNYIQRSLTAGLVKNDGSIDTTEYATASDLDDKQDTLVVGDGIDITNTTISLDMSYLTGSNLGIGIATEGVASSTTIREQLVTIDEVDTTIDGTRYMEQTATTSTSATTIVTFTHAAITTDTVVDFYCSQWNLVPDDIVCNNGTCAVTLPVVDTSATVTVRIYLR